MGVVICKEHGRQEGSLGCDHVLSAVRNNVHPKPTLIHFSVDLLNDGTTVLQHSVCSACAEQFHLVEGTRLTGEEWEEPGRLPRLDLLCRRCLDWAQR
jgi:hypothetical protein